MTDSRTGRCAGRYVGRYVDRCAGRYADPLRYDADDVDWVVNRTPLLGRKTEAGHEVDRKMRLVPGFRFVEKLHACRLLRIGQLKGRDKQRRDIYDRRLPRTPWLPDRLSSISQRKGGF